MVTDRVIPQNIKENIRILIVEDSVFCQKQASIMLHTWGFTYDICDNGAAAIEILKSRKYDLILMDIEMPEMDGFQTTVKIRNDLKLGMPIIATTARVTEEDRQKCLSLGMNDYIPKPLNEEQLYNLVTNYLFTTVVENIDNRLVR
jgi:CheY-like chemotaxis protein